MKFIIGLAIGIATGLLVAPRRGEETREQLLEKGRELAERPQRALRDKVRDIGQQTERKAGDLGSELGRNAAQSAVRNITEAVSGEQKKPA